MKNHQPNIAEDFFNLDLPANPYPGLRPFQDEEWPIFFGRETMTNEVINNLIQKKLVVVHGDSGCGKSSLIRAGVLPRLEQEHARGGANWRTCAMCPGTSPIENLASSLAELQGQAADNEQVNRFLRLLARGESAGEAIGEEIRVNSKDNICILVDQFEELFAFFNKTRSDDALLFVNILTGVMKNPSPGLHMILTMRSEFLGACARFEELAEVVNDTQYLLPRMSRYSLTRAIREPAQLYNGSVSAELAIRIIDETENAQDQLPLIQHGLMLMFHRKLGDQKITESNENLPPWALDLEDYDESGGVVNLLSEHADTVAEAIDIANDNGMQILEAIFRALTDIDADGNAIRRPQKLKELAAVAGVEEEVIRSVIQPMREDGVSFLRPYGQRQIQGHEIIDISHEALIRCWNKISDKNNGWLYKEFEDGLVWKSLLVRADDTSNVLSASELADREKLIQKHNEFWAKRYADDKNPRGGWDAVNTLLKASADNVKQLKRRKFYNQIGIWAIVLIPILGYMTYDLFNRNELLEIETKNAQVQAKIAQERLGEIQDLNQQLKKERSDLETAIAELKESELENKKLKSRLLTEKTHEANKFGDSYRALSLIQPLFENRDDLPYVPEAEIAAYEILFGLVKYQTPPGIDFSTRFSSFSYDGELLLTVSSDNEIRITDIHTGENKFKSFKLDESIRSAQLSNNNACILTSTKNFKLQIWELESGKEIFTVDENFDNPLRLAQLSPDCSHLATVYGNNEALLYNLQSTNRLVQLVNPEVEVNEFWVTRVQFSTDNKFILMIFENAPMRIWSTETGKQLSELGESNIRITDARFSNNSKWIVTDNYTEALIWDWQTGAELKKLIGHTDWLRSIQFSNDDKRVITTSYDNTAQIWDSETGEQLTTLSHFAEVSNASFSNDDKYIITSGGGFIRVWDAKTGEELGLPRFNPEFVDIVSFSSDAKQILARTGNADTRIWDIMPVISAKLSNLDDLEELAYTNSKGRQFQKSSGQTLRLSELGGISQIAFTKDGGSLAWTSPSLSGYLFSWKHSQKIDPTLTSLPNDLKVDAIEFVDDEPLLILSPLDVFFLPINEILLPLSGEAVEVQPRTIIDVYKISDNGRWMAMLSKIDQTIDIYRSSSQQPGAKPKFWGELNLPERAKVNKYDDWYLTYAEFNEILIGVNDAGMAFAVDLHELSQSYDADNPFNKTVDLIEITNWNQDIKRIITVEEEVAIALSKSDSSQLMLFDINESDKVIPINLDKKFDNENFHVSINSKAERAVLITGGDDVKLISFEEGGVIASLKLPGKRFETAAISDDGRSVAAITEGGEAVIWPVYSDRYKLSDFIDEHVKKRIAEEELYRLLGPDPVAR